MNILRKFNVELFYSFFLDKYIQFTRPKLKLKGQTSYTDMSVFYRDYYTTMVNDFRYMYNSENGIKEFYAFIMDLRLPFCFLLSSVIFLSREKRKRMWSFIHFSYYTNVYLLIIIGIEEKKS
jgi:hypothetical protein